MPRQIPYGHQSIDADDIAAVTDVLHSEWLTTGPRVPQFEKTLCDFTGSRDAVAVNSGTSALDIAVAALDLPPGSEVITTPFTFAATANAILYNDGIPVFADITADTRNIDPEEIRKKITSRTRAIICMDYAGHPCELAEIRSIAQEHNLRLIDDACHALGAEYNGKRLGTFADMTIFSFHPVKPVTTGEGGAVVTNDSTLAGRLRLLRNHGIDRDVPHSPEQGWAYDMTLLGRNYRLTDLQAALGTSQMRRLSKFLERRNQIAALYREYLQDVPQIVLPHVQNGMYHGWHLFTVLIGKGNRDTVYADLKEQGIGAQVHYIPIYRFSYYRRRFPALVPDAFPVTENIFGKILTLPLYPAMTDDDVAFCADRLRRSIRKTGGSR
ncbi:MAG: UDP-4-amino-4,6-dideoxy-N-acetyl-beta-L-altrosamine transaminase [Methanomicrobiales archaeon]|nr:UDP-4-amino-4,6-dideoxy-N-acetyl-beta-L-altrosamine transaminase [Methanomicrobiales archaeon]